ncbi:juxtaposed with another zinc finger protein 1 isoform X2 [Ciconia boyciana]|uniref:juxtaposed with another zinc finger protein 1 isoform X2 n=1 Tax=Ciconia boyciana TaxID=52775 RepID=UPI003BA22349
MTGIAAASFFSNACRFGGCGLHFPTLAELIEHIEDNHIDTDPRVLEKQELQQPTYVALSYINRFMTDAARREQESLKKKIQPKLSLTLSSTVSRGNVSTPPRHSSGSLTPPVTPPITPSSSFRSSTPTDVKEFLLSFVLLFVQLLLGRLIHDVVSLAVPTQLSSPTGIPSTASTENEEYCCIPSVRSCLICTPSKLLLTRL